MLVQIRVQPLSANRVVEADSEPCLVMAARERTFICIPGIEECR